MPDTETPIDSRPIATVEEVEEWLDKARMRLDVATTKDERQRAREQIRRCERLLARLQDEATRP